MEGDVREVDKSQNTLPEMFSQFLSDTQKQVTLSEMEYLMSQVNDIEISTASDYEALCKFVEELVKPGVLKDVPEHVNGHTNQELEEVAESAVKCFINLKLLLLKLKVTKLTLRKCEQSIFIPILTLCGAHSEICPWSNETTVNLSNEIQKEILVRSEMSCMKDLLCLVDETGHSSIFKSTLLSLRHSLTKESWTRNPSICLAFKWLLFQVTHPDLTDYLLDVLPTSLMFTDHYHAQSKVLGIECLYHIIDNIPPTELKMYGRADVIYDALYHLTYCKELDVVRVLYPCLLQLLIGQEGNMHCKLFPRKWCRYDIVYHQLTWHMDMEDSLALRREFSKCVPEFVKEMGITILKHLKRSLRILLDYLKIYDGPDEVSRINALKGINAIIKVAWPRMGYHCKNILKGIMDLIRDIKAEPQTSTSAVKKILGLCQECMTLLETACPEKFQQTHPKPTEGGGEESTELKNGNHEGNNCVMLSKTST